jgi:hypothetical protein
MWWSINFLRTIYCHCRIFCWRIISWEGYWSAEKTSKIFSYQPLAFSPFCGGRHAEIALRKMARLQIKLIDFVIKHNYIKKMLQTLLIAYFVLSIVLLTSFQQPFGKDLFSSICVRSTLEQETLLALSALSEI